MRSISATVGQTVILLVLAVAVGLGVNTVRGKDKINLSRNYFPQAVRQPSPSDAPAAGGATEPGAPELAAEPKSEFSELSLEDVIALYDDPRSSTGEFVFVDARADGPFRDGHIPGAVQCDYYRSEHNLPGVLDRVYGAQKVIVYCHGGDCDDSLLVCREFVNLAVPMECIYLFRGGWEAWKQSGLPFDQGEK